MKEELTRFLPKRSGSFPHAIAPNMLPKFIIEPNNEYYKQAGYELIRFMYGPNLIQQILIFQEYQIPFGKWQ